MDKSLEGKLLKGLDVKVGDIVIKSYTLGVIFDEENGIGLQNYYRLLQPAVLKPRDLEIDDILEQNPPDRRTIFDIACMFKDVQEMFLQFLNTFTYHTWVFNDVFNEFVAWLDNGHIVINRKNIDEIFAVARKMYGLDRSRSKEDELKPVNDEVAQALKEFQEWEESIPQDNSGITLDSIIESVTVKGEYTLFDVWNLTPYQLIKTFNRINTVDYYDNVMRGVYAGTVDSKAIKDLHWAKKSDA